MLVTLTVVALETRTIFSKEPKLSLSLLSTFTAFRSVKTPLCLVEHGFFDHTSFQGFYANDEHAEAGRALFVASLSIAMVNVGCFRFFVVESLATGEGC